MPETIFKDVPTEVGDVACLKYCVGDFAWYIMAAEKTSNDDDYCCYGLVDFLEREFGYFMLSEILSIGAIRDTTFQPAPIDELVIA